MKTGKAENRFLTDEEERWFGEVVRKTMSQRPSVPAGTKCPAPEIIHKLAFHEKIDTATAKTALLHIAECYECSQLVTSYVNEYREQKKMIGKLTGGMTKKAKPNKK